MSWWGANAGNRQSWGRTVVLRDFPDELMLGTFEDEALPGGGLLTPQAASARVDAWMASGRADRFALVELAGLVGQTAPETLEQRQALQRELSSALQTGLLRLFTRRMAPPLAPAPRQTPAPPPKPSAGPKEDKKTWIAIRLVDESDPPKPMAFKRYRVELPDASVREGKLDSNGEARFVDIDPGTCKVTFPDQDASEWRAA
jgi:hypothetical protein